jgi:hypothetical protein
LSTQTQLASLRGALEAARLREEKHKAEMERYTKELEALRWENMNSKRGEVEVGTFYFFGSWMLVIIPTLNYLLFYYETLRARICFLL